MSTKRYCDVCQVEIVGAISTSAGNRTDEFKLVLSATRHVVNIQAAPEGWPDRTTDICRNCLLGALCLAWDEGAAAESAAPKPAEARDIVGSVIIPAKHYWPHNEGAAYYGQRRQYVVRHVHLHRWNGQNPVPEFDLFTVSADLTLQALLP